MPFRKLLVGGGGSGGESSGGVTPMFPLNSVISCNWDSSNNKPDVLEIDSEDDSKLNLKATDFPVILNFANGLDDDDQLKNIIKEITEDQVLDLSSHAGNSVLISAQILDGEVSIVTNRHINVDEESDIVPDLNSSPQDGYIATSSGGTAYYAFTNSSSSQCTTTTKTSWIQLIMPSEVILGAILVESGYSGTYLDKICAIDSNDQEQTLYDERISLPDNEYLRFDIVDIRSFKGYKIYLYGGSQPYSRITEIKTYARDAFSYNRSLNKVKNAEGTEIYSIELGYAVVDDEGSITSIYSVIDLTPNAPGGLKVE